jgi:hypothetical protein
MVNHCANPNCSKPFLYLSEGRLFAFDVPDPRGPVISGRIAHRREHHWLCGECSQTFVLMRSCETGVLLAPKRAQAMPGVLASQCIPGFHGGQR